MNLGGSGGDGFAVERFAGQRLGDQPHIAVLFCDSIGDFVVATPLLAAIRSAYPHVTMDYYSGPRTAELEVASGLIDYRADLFGQVDFATVARTIAHRREVAGPYDLAINLDSSPLAAVAAGQTAAKYVVGACVSTGGRDMLEQGLDGVDALHRENWAADDFLPRYRSYLASQHIGEIFCALARFEYPEVYPKPSIGDPKIAIPDVLIAMGASRSAKLWPVQHWRKLVDALVRSGYSVGLLGAAEEEQRASYCSWEDEQSLLESIDMTDMRGKLSLPQVVGALATCRLCVTIDNGIMHLAARTGGRVVAIFGGSAWRVWAPSVDNLKVVLPLQNCVLCRDNRFRNKHCLIEEKVCMTSNLPTAVVSAAMGLLLEG